MSVTSRVTRPPSSKRHASSPATKTELRSELEERSHISPRTLEPETRPDCVGAPRPRALSFSFAMERETRSDSGRPGSATSALPRRRRPSMLGARRARRGRSRRRWAACNLTDLACPYPRHSHPERARSSSFARVPSPREENFLPQD